MFRPLAAGFCLFMLHAVFAPVSDADHAPLLYRDGTIVHGDWGLYRPGHMPLRFEGPYEFYQGRRYGEAYQPVYKDDPVPAPTLKGYEPNVRGFFPSRSGTFYPTNKEDPGAYTPRENENGPTQSPERYFKQWGTSSETCNTCEDGKKDYSDPTIYPKWDMPDNVYVPVQPPHGKKP